MRRLFLALMICSASGNSFGQEMLGSKREAFMLLPATAVASGSVMNFEFSPSGNYLFLKRLPGKEVFNLIEMKPPKEKIKNFVFNIKSGNLKEVPLEDPTGTLEVTILGDDQHIFFMDRARPNYQGFYNLTSGVITPTKLDQTKIFYLGDTPGCGWLMTELSDSEVQIVTPLGQAHKLSLGPSIGIQKPYREDQNYIYAAGYSRPYGKFYNLTIRKADFSVQPTLIARNEFFKLEGLNLRPIFSIEKSDQLTSLNYEYLLPVGNPKSKDSEKNAFEDNKTAIPKSVALTTSESLARLSPNQKTIAYLNGGALLVREISPVDPKLAEKAEEEKLKAKAIQDAKQVGMAMQIFAADNDDKFPSGEDFNQKLMPYLKNSKVLEGFTFTSKFKNMNEMKDPSNEEIGFKSGPGGRAVVYGDGHVKWKPGA